jgi:hypothetical protein
MNKRLCESRVVYSERPEARLVVTEIHGIRYRTQGVVSTTRSLATHNFTRGVATCLHVTRLSLRYLLD